MAADAAIRWCIRCGHPVRPSSARAAGGMPACAGMAAGAGVQLLRY